MWNTDVVKFQTATKQNFSGIEKATWVLNGNTVLCDVQDISREKVLKEYGITDEGSYKKVFDTSMSPYWVEMTQVEFNNEQYTVRNISTWNKMSASNSIQVILKKVV